MGRKKKPNQGNKEGGGPQGTPQQQPQPERREQAPPAREQPTAETVAAATEQLNIGAAPQQQQPGIPAGRGQAAGRGQGRGLPTGQQQQQPGVGRGQGRGSAPPGQQQQGPGVPVGGRGWAPAAQQQQQQPHVPVGARGWALPAQQQQPPPVPSGRGTIPSAPGPPGPHPGAWGAPRPPVPVQPQQQPQPPPKMAWGAPRAQAPSAAPVQSPLPPQASSRPPESSPSPAPSVSGSSASSESVGATGGGERTRAKGPSPKLSEHPGLKLPKRDKGGTLGREILLDVNHFRVKIHPSIQTVYHYDVEVGNARANRKAIREAVMDLLKTPRFRDYNPVFDGNKNIYTPRRIDGLEGPMTVEHEIEEREFAEGGEPRIRRVNYTIQIQPTGTLELDVAPLLAYTRGGSSLEPPQSIVQAFDIALRHHPSTRLTAVRSSFFTPRQGAANIGAGCEVWFGHYQSLRLGWQPFVNIDVSQKAFLKAQKVHHWFAEFYRLPEGQTPRFGHTDFEKKIRAVKVKYPRAGYEAKVGVNGLKGPANQERFESNGRMVTVQEYFQQAYRITLRFPNLPCLWVGSRQRNNLVPMEICSVEEGQVVRGKLTDIQTAEMIKYTAKPADERRRRIMDSVKNLNFSQDPFARAFGLAIEGTMMQIKGRVLPAPKLAYGDGKDRETSSMFPRDGAWNMRNLQFIWGKEMKSWGIVSITRLHPGEIQRFVQALQQAGNGMGMTIGDPKFTDNCDPRDLPKKMQEIKKRFGRLDILLVLIERKGDPNYDVVKRCGDLELEQTTQCIQKRNVLGKPDRGPDPSTMSNICLKLNAKLGGVNNLIDKSCRPKFLLSEQIMIMGADVTHPTPDQLTEGRPSIAAVVGSVDPRAFQYCTEIRLQTSRQEHIEEMESMVYNLLRKFNRVTGTTSTGKPQRIIFYRDGVSEGQFLQILLYELSAIRKACKRLHPDYEPPITFIIVQKRHHTRLFPKNPKDECGRGKNVPPGTVVDTEIVHPTENDFYLVSHAGIQGTSRPTHYHLLWDDNQMTSDQLQLMTYYLCYMYSRCTRSVSYPAPCYYAHLVADRGRRYYDGLKATGRRMDNRQLQESIDHCSDLQFMFFV